MSRKEQLRVFDMVSANRKRALFDGALDIIDDTTGSQLRFLRLGFVVGGVLGILLHAVLS